MKKILTALFIVFITICLTACQPTTAVPEKALQIEKPLMMSASRNPSKALDVHIEVPEVAYYKYRFTFLSEQLEGMIIQGETEGWEITETSPNEWLFYFTQGKWRFEVVAFDSRDSEIASVSREGYISKASNDFADAIGELLSNFHGNGSLIFKDLILPALYSDKTNFYVKYVLSSNGQTIKDGSVPMKDVPNGSGVATLEEIKVDNIPAGNYEITLQVFEVAYPDSPRGGSSEDNIIVYPGCKSTVTGFFGDSGKYVEAEVRTFQTATTFTGKVDSTKLNIGGDNTYDNFKFICTADNPTNIRWFVDGIEQTEITSTVRTENTTTHYYWKCPSCGYEHDTTSKPKTGSKGTTCDEYVGFLTWCNGRCQAYTQKEVPNGTYHNETITKPADGTETEFTVQLSQMGHGNSGATTHYVECIYTDVEGHTSSSTQEMFVGSNYFPNLGASSIFVMGNGNEIAYWDLEMTPDTSLVNNNFFTYTTAGESIRIYKDSKIHLTPGLWNITKATAYDDEDMALIETTNPKSVYINQLNPYINIEDAVKSETTETGTIRIRDLKMNSLTWTCNYATGTIDPFKVDTDITVYKLTDEGKDDSSFTPLSLHIDGCTLLETGKTISGTSSGKNYSYHNDTYQIVGESTERDFTVPEGIYRVQIKINSGTRNNYITSYGGRNNDSYKSYYSGVTEGDLEVIVNVQAHTTQVVTGTLSCNHCLKTDGTI